MVRNNDKAWHASRANSDSIGIEHIANGDRRVGPLLRPTEAEYCASAALTRWLCDTFGIPIDRTHVLGHSEADPQTSHTDCPNAVWDWDYYMGLVQSATSQSQALSYLPAPPAAIVRSQAVDTDGTSSVSGSAGVIAWDLDQFRGTKNPSQ